MIELKQKIITYLVAAKTSYLNKMKQKKTRRQSARRHLQNHEELAVVT